MTTCFLVSMVENATSTDCQQTNAASVVSDIRSGRWCAPVQEIRTRFAAEITATSDRTEAKRLIGPLKKALPAVMWSGTFRKRDGTAIEQHSGLLVADLDDLPAADLARCRSALVADPHVYCVFTSPTGTGLKAVFRVPAAPSRHRDSYRAVESQVRQTCGVGIDPSGKDLARLCFVSHDPEAYINEAARELAPLAPKRASDAVVKTKAQRQKADSQSPVVLNVRQAIAETILPGIRWESDSEGFVACPGIDKHTGPDGKRDCRVLVDGAPTISCFHSSCQAEVDAANRELRSKIGKLEHNLANHTTEPGQNGRRSPTPCEWFRERFPTLSPAKLGDPVWEEEKEGKLCVKSIGEDFLAATLGHEGTPASPTVFLPAENRFYSYDPQSGIYVQKTEAALARVLSQQLLECARACEEVCQTKRLEFSFRSSTALAGILKKARGQLEKPHDFFAHGLTEFLPCANGMLRLSDRKLLPFGPEFRRRNKLAASFVPEAQCPQFEALMNTALDPADIGLLRRWSGLALIGDNMSQCIMVLCGTAGGGKGTFISVLTGIIGQENLGQLRPALLADRFELGRHADKTLLYGPDVPEDFFNHKGASVLKSLTGHDPLTLEFKNSNEAPATTGRFNVAVTSNCRLRVNLEGDRDAWRRRLALVIYRKPKPERPIADLAQKILAEESPGVLNWMLDGLDRLRADRWELRLTEPQQAAVDDLLLESDSVSLFVRERVVPTQGKRLTMADGYCAYTNFCGERGWNAVQQKEFNQTAPEMVMRFHRIASRNDVLDCNRKQQRGWRGLALRETNPRPTENNLSEPSENRLSDETDGISKVGSEGSPEPEVMLL